ncbi:MAG: radical SAM family heme chaperone HemW [Microscillaceae bacterium]|nr:radical SAM family heme chaperone HemW [Microscillaceae bacterium]
MTSLYIHIPFCKQACHYCDFHFRTNRRQQAEMVAAIAQEAHLQADYLPSRHLQSLYFGGGTPSLLSEAELSFLWQQIHEIYILDAQAEITLEANPDDLNKEKLDFYRALGINRLSIGIQTFHEGHLRFLNRAHNAQQARQVVEMAQEAGFSQISIDLIYGIPAGDHQIWQQDLAEALRLEVPHISAYCLTIEEKTVFGHWQRQQKLAPASDDFAYTQFEMLREALLKAAYEHYEVSNFAHSGAYARHNTHYWQGKPYLGLGPSAHSYKPPIRQHNIANNSLYMAAIRAGEIPAAREVLSPQERRNEFIMTRLRTIWGLDLQEWQETFGFDFASARASVLAPWLEKGLVILKEGKLRLRPEGLFLGDALCADLFWEAEES